jgi:hypothetical protein
VRSRQSRELRDWHPQPRRTEQVGKGDHARARGDRRGEPVDDGASVIFAWRNPHLVDDDAVFAGDVVPAHAAAGVFLVGCQHSIARRPGESLCDPVHAIGRASGEHEFVGLALDEGRRLRTHFVHRSGGLGVAVEDGIALQVFPRGNRAIEDRLRRRPQRAGVEIDQPWIEQVVGRRRQSPHLARESRAASWPDVAGVRPSAALESTPTDARNDRRDFVTWVSRAVSRGITPVA